MKGSNFLEEEITNTYNLKGGGGVEWKGGGGKTCCVLPSYFAFLSFSLISTQTFRGALTASVDSSTEINIKCPFSGLTKHGGFEECAGKRGFV